MYFYYIYANECYLNISYFVGFNRQSFSLDNSVTADRNTPTVVQVVSKAIIRYAKFEPFSSRFALSGFKEFVHV